MNETSPSSRVPTIDYGAQLQNQARHFIQIRGTGLMIGQTVSQFNILEKLGSSGTGVMHNASERLPGLDVALVILPLELLCGKALGLYRKLSFRF